MNRQFLHTYMAKNYRLDLPDRDLADIEAICRQGWTENSVVSELHDQVLRMEDEVATLQANLRLNRFNL